MKKSYIRMAAGLLAVVASGIFLFSVCTENGGKSGDSSLKSIKIGAKNVSSQSSLGTGNADWAKVKPGLVKFESTETELTVTLAAETKHGGTTVKFAKIDSAADEKPAFSGETGFTFKDGDYLAIEVTAENGTHKTYYKIELKITDPKEKFHIYLAFGQSNMVGYLGTPIASSEDIGSSDTKEWVADYDFDTPPENFVVMAAANDNKNPYGRKKAKWYAAKPPLVRNNTGLSPADFFGRTVAEAVANKDIKVGVIVVAVDGCEIILFSKDINVFKNYIGGQQNWMTNQAVAYVDSSISSITSSDFTTTDYPYKRLVDLAQLAQEEGVIKGIIMHQGESGGNLTGKTYPQTVRQIYNDLCGDLGLEPGSIPFLAGQAVGNSNYNIASIPGAFSDLPNTAFVISSDECPGWNPSSSVNNAKIHFSFDGYKKLGTRYGEKMLELLYE